MTWQLTGLRREQMKKILFLTAYWTVAAVFIVLYDSVLLGFQSTAEGADYNFATVILYVVAVTFISGFLLAAFEVLYLGPTMRRQPLGKALVLKTSFYILCIGFCVSLALLLIFAAEENASLLSEKTWKRYVHDSVLSGQLIMSMAYWGFSVLMALFIIQVSEKFGTGVLVDFLLGRYHHPKEEDRIFMFLDLKSSTTVAEKLGHLRYSLLLQDCFYDLTDIVMMCDARIYQYVGDEVVLTWETKKGIRNHNCIRVFFSFEAILRSRQEYYTNRYGLVPEFKASLNVGKVTVAEVGVIKKELAYHGDVLNTAARIQEKCNEYGFRLLVSEQLRSRISSMVEYSMQLVGDIPLRGKQNNVRIYAIQPVMPD